MLLSCEKVIDIAISLLHRDKVGFSIKIRVF